MREGWLIKENGSGRSELYGLTADEVMRSRREHGRNVLTPKKRISFIRRFIGNLGDPIIKILIGALCLNLLFLFRSSDYIECIGIGVSVILATLISTLSEHSSENAFLRLESEYSSGRVRVIRSGGACEIDCADVVVGDVLILGAGEQIPADGEVIKGRILCDQSAMTGESREVEKYPIGNSERARKSYKEYDMSPSSPHFCFRGCMIHSGSAYVSVRRVGDKTFLGGISEEIQEDSHESPLKARLSRLARQISTFGYIAASLIALVFLFKCFVIDSAFTPEIIKYKISNIPFLVEKLLSALTLGLTVIVVAVPEGLPMMIAVVLSSNIKKMVRDNVLVRKPVGIESAGSMNILFTDKTGTLTCGRLEVGEVICGDGRAFCNAAKMMREAPSLFDEYAISASVNTDAQLGISGTGQMAALGGNSTDRAILSSVAEAMDIRTLDASYRICDARAVERLEFDSRRKYSAAIADTEQGRLLYIKGAPEKLLPYIKGYIASNGERVDTSPSRIRGMYDKRTAEGKRVLLVARAESQIPLSSLEKGFPSLLLIAAVVLEDKLRDTASRSVSELHSAGISVVMITGDNKNTAVSIASECGILSGDKCAALDASELSHMTDDEVKAVIPRLGVVARALPRDKSRLVRLSQEMGLVVGMTGDGVNDAPALRAADVGFAMGSGVQVAKDAGDIIILDNDLSSIVRAVKYGRGVFKSIRKFISLQLMMNFCAVGVSMICPFLGINSPVTVVQMLWINIIMDTLGGLAFAGEPAPEACMHESPKKRDEQILNSYMLNEIVFLGGFTIALYLFFLKCPRITSLFRYDADDLYLLTAFFALFIFSSVFNCFNARTDRVRLFAGISKNKPFILIMCGVLFIQILFIYLGGPVLRTLPLTLRELGITFVLSLLVFPADLLRKYILKLLGKKKGY